MAVDGLRNGVLLVALATGTLVHAQSSGTTEEELQRPTLKGLPGVVLLVDTPAAHISASGRTDIITDVELTLRSAGIRLYPIDQLKSGARLPLLLISFSVAPSEAGDNLVAWGLSVRLSQNITLARDPAIYSWAPTWEVPGKFGFGPRAWIPAKARDEIIGAARRFANAYLSVNPK